MNNRRFKRWTFAAVCCLLLLGTALPAAGAQSRQEPLICLDPGHQRYGNNELEPVGPGAKEMKPKVTSGTRGVQTKKPEHVLTLEASQRIKERLEELGFRVIMTRETHDVDISNKERAAFCNQAGADLGVRIHADGDTSPRAHGMSMLYPAQSGYSEPIYERSKAAADVVLSQVLAATGAASRGAVPRSDLSGFNWSQVPSILLEMGFMTNPDEDAKLSDPAYLNRLAEGVAEGVNRYFAVTAQGAQTAGQAKVFLPESARLYMLSDGKLLRTTLALMPQTVQSSAVWGDWRKVDTWVGERWVYTGPFPIALQPSTDRIELKRETPMYRSPRDTAPLGALSPQSVQTTARWNQWFLIDTWLGKLWISQ